MRSLLREFYKGVDDLLIDMSLLADAMKKQEVLMLLMMK